MLFMIINKFTPLPQQVPTGILMYLENGEAVTEYNECDFG